MLQLYFKVKFKVYAKITYRETNSVMKNENHVLRKWPRVQKRFIGQLHNNKWVKYNLPPSGFWYPRYGNTQSRDQSSKQADLCWFAPQLISTTQFSEGTIFRSTWKSCCTLKEFFLILPNSSFCLSSSLLLLSLFQPKRM